MRWKHGIIWRAVGIKLRNKIRLLGVGRSDKLLYLTRRRRQFAHFRVSMHFFNGLADKERIRNSSRIPASHRVEIIRQAEKILCHRFNLLGSGEVDLGSQIDWHRDFKSDYRWLPKYYLLLDFDRARGEWYPRQADIKVPWELSRFQHLTVLGQAYWLSGDEEHTREFMEEIIHWIAENPPEKGPNWVSSMDISLRVVSLIMAYFFFRTSPLIPAEFWSSYYNLLYYSGVHIEQNPEIRHNGYRSNHHLTNCAALTWLGLFFGSYNKRTLKWLNYGHKNMGVEMKHQVNSDGGSFEGSISYHRLALEIFLSTTILAELNGLTFPEWYKERLAKMCEFSLNYRKPNGLAPQFGDADDGRFLILSGYGSADMRDHRSLLGLAGEYFQRNDFRAGATDKYLDALWLFGTGRITENPLAGPQKKVYPELFCYPETGFYMVRKDDVFLMMKCGKIGQKLTGGHDHNDQLSFELNVGGVDLIIDPGSYVYTMDRDLRQLFRSTKYHNVSQPGNLEQNIIKNEDVRDLFTFYSSNPGECKFFAKTAEGDVGFSGGIRYAESELYYSRAVKLRPSARCLEIADSFSRTMEIATCRLHLDRDVQVELLGERRVKLQRAAVQVSIEADSPIRVEHGMVSPSYGLKFDSLVLCWDFHCQTRFKIYF